MQSSKNKKFVGTKLPSFEESWCHHIPSTLIQGDKGDKARTNGTELVAYSPGSWSVSGFFTQKIHAMERQGVLPRLSLGMLDVCLTWKEFFVFKMGPNICF